MHHVETFESIHPATGLAEAVPQNPAIKKIGYAGDVGEETVITRPGEHRVRGAAGGHINSRLSGIGIQCAAAGSTGDGAPIGVVIAWRGSGPDVWRCNE